MGIITDVRKRIISFFIVLSLLSESVTLTVN
jgi:hypothetical protein